MGHKVSTFRLPSCGANSASRIFPSISSNVGSIKSLKHRYSIQSDQNQTNSTYHPSGGGLVPFRTLTICPLVLKNLQDNCAIVIFFLLRFRNDVLLIHEYIYIIFLFFSTPIFFSCSLHCSRTNYYILLFFLISAHEERKKEKQRITKKTHIHKHYTHTNRKTEKKARL